MTTPGTTDRSAADVGDEQAGPGAGATGRRVDVRRYGLPVALGVLVALAFAPVFHRLVTDRSNLAYGYNDYGIHLEMASRFEWFPLTVVVPHPIFHGFAATFALLIGEEPGAVAALCVGAGAGVIAIYWLGRRAIAPMLALPRWLAAAVALYLTFFETPVTALNGLDWLDRPRTYMHLHPWANPTDVFALPIALVFVWVMVRALAEPGPEWFRPTAPRLLLAVATVVGAMSKPAVSLALLPAFGLYTLLGGAGLRRRLATVLPWCALPAAAVLAWQYWIIKTRPLAVEIGYSTYGIEIAPLRHIGFLGFGPGGPWLFWPSILWVGLAAWAGGRDFLRYPPIRLTLCALPGVAALSLLLTETGNQSADMNLVRSVTYAFLPLVYFSVIFLAGTALRQVRHRSEGSGVPLWLPATALMTVLWAVGGLFMYVDLIGIADWFSLQPTSVLPRLR